MKGFIRRQGRIYRRICGGLRHFVAGICLLATLLYPASARACPNCGCVVEAYALTDIQIGVAIASTQLWIKTQMQLHRDVFMVHYFFQQHILSAMQDMTEQLTGGAMLQMNAIGAFLDAKHQLETQRLFQQKAAQAHKDYQPSMEMCVMGTAAEGLAAAYRNGEATALLLAKRSQNRQLHAQDVSGTSGADIDVNARLKVFRERYCDIHDANDGLKPMCSKSAPVESMDKDVDYTRTILHPLTLDVDYSDGTLTGDEQDVLALGNNLYAHDTFPKVAQSLLDKEGNANIIMDQRALVAKRSVAENSYNAVVGMKAADSEAGKDNAKYLDVILQQMGASQGDARALIGEKPSYYARMELLTKKIYQDPNFYVALYDTPANIARKGAAIRAIGLMQHMDMFKSRLRNEAILAELVELEVSAAQSDAQNRQNKVREKGARH
jgi:hypothetical protein